MNDDRFRTDPSDGMDAMVVGSWSQQKHASLSDYIVASRLARAKWQHACYVDVFCGPGRVVERGTNTFRDGGAIAAWKASRVADGRPFSAVYIGDLHQQSVAVCRQRLESIGAPVRSFIGSALETVQQIVAGLPRGLHLAFVDPFNAEQLNFEIIRALSTQPFIDILVHFSVMDIQRNIDVEAATSGMRLERIAPGWRDAIDLSNLPKSSFVNAFLDHWKQLVWHELHMTAADMMPLIRNSKNGPLYRLIMLRRHRLAEKLWNDVGKEDKHQKTLF